MNEKSKLVINPLKEMFVKSGKRILSNKMKKMDASDALPGFPVLTEEYLRSLTFGIYQLKQAKSYSREDINEKGGYEIYVSQTSPDIIQVKIQSRHVSSKMYYLWIQYDGKDKEDPIKYWYCQCKSGARMVGSCAHVASSAYKDMKMMLVVKLYPIIFWTARRLLLRIFHLLVMNMIPLHIRLYCIFFLFQTLN